jgi:hypothetical protein
MEWTLRRLKNAMPRENRKILSLTMVNYPLMIIPPVLLYARFLKIIFSGCWFLSDDQFPSEEDEELLVDGGDSLVPYASDAHELSLFHESEGDDEEEESVCADLRGGWGRIIYSPMRRGKQVQMDVCRSTKRDASEGTFERIVVTQSKNPALHFQARRSLWGDLWPF